MYAKVDIFTKFNGKDTNETIFKELIQYAELTQKHLDKMAKLSSNLIRGPGFESSPKHAIVLNLLGKKFVYEELVYAVASRRYSIYTKN